MVINDWQRIRWHITLEGAYWIVLHQKWGVQGVGGEVVPL